MHSTLNTSTTATTTAAATTTTTAIGHHLCRPLLNRLSFPVAKNELLGTVGAGRLLA